MRTKINAIGDVCPLPVVKAKKAFDEGASAVEIRVDNEIAVENLQKLAKSKGAAFSYEKKSDKEYVCILEENAGQSLSGEKADKNVVVVIASRTMGAGDDTLGANLMKGFIYSLSQADELPKTILFYNSGAFITTEGSVSIEDLKALEAGGVEIMTCGACLNHYHLADKLEVGSVTNMYEIVEKQLKASSIIRP